MPRSMQEILRHDEELARRFEEFEPDNARVTVTPLGELFEAVRGRAAAERLIAERVRAARRSGSSWAVIGQILGTSGEAARKRYGMPGP